MSLNTLIHSSLEDSSKMGSKYFTNLHTSDKGMICIRPDQIHTLIFMDFETTGLIPSNLESSRPTPGDKNRSISQWVSRCIDIHDRPSEMPQITEMAFVSVPRQLFASAIEDIHSEAQFDDNGPLIRKIPSNIYASQIRPNFNPLQWKQYEMDQRHCSAMHLNEADLKFKNSFSTEWPAVHLFLQNQKKPACIIAHNGANFDFRILYAEIVRNKLLEAYPMPDGIFFLDSYLALLDIERFHLDNLAITTSSIDWEMVNGVLNLAKRSNSTVIEEEEEAEIIVTSTTTEANNKNNSNFVSDSLEILDDLEELKPQTSCFQVQQNIMRTPPRRGAPESSKSSSGLKRGRHLFPDEDEVLPLSFINKSNWSPAKKRRIQSSFFRRTSETNWEFNEFTARDYFLKGNFKLESLYKQVTKATYDAHHALDDCHALMQVCLAYGDDFLNYMDKRREKISKFHPSKTATSKNASTTASNVTSETNNGSSK